MEEYLGLNVLGVVKLFLWKAGNDLLATKNNLFCKEIVEYHFYHIYLRGEETVMQVMWQCPMANYVWIEALSPVHK